MDVVDALGEPEPPSQAAYAAARAALMRQAAAARVSSPESSPRASRGRRAGVPRSRRTGWLAGGLALAAGAVAAVVVILVGGTVSGPAAGPAVGPAPSGHRGTQAVSRLSGKQILLEAANGVASQPETTGKYWYVNETDPPQLAKWDGGLTQSYVSRDGASYVYLPQYKGVALTGEGYAYLIANRPLTYAQIQRLPTDPAALTAWMTRSFGYTPHQLGALAPNMAESLMQLLGQVPAPPALRAAAFRALAAMPEVTKVGQAGTNVKLQISLPGAGQKMIDGTTGRPIPAKVAADLTHVWLTIDTSTFSLRSFTVPGTIPASTVTILAARWTNTLPKVLPASDYTKFVASLPKPKGNG
jgi:hypothetical protein